MKSVHPWDPHPPNFSRLLPEFLRPYPSFEGWFFRILDTQSGVSIGLIIATNYATSESHATLVFTGGNPSKDGGIMQDGLTRMVYEVIKDARITQASDVQDNNGKSLEVIGFDWEAPEIGKVVARNNITSIDICVKGYHLKANLTSKVHWNQSYSYKGPEGWASIIPLPTHWHILSLGSKASYEFKNINDMDIRGQGWAHEEKNWGEIFPAVHVWMQAFSNDNDVQLVCSVVYYKLGNVKTPYIFAMGYRSPDHKFDMRTIDIGTTLKVITLDPQRGEFSMRASNPSYSIQITSVAAPESFCEPILAPVGKLEWKPTCRESYLANINVEVYDHAVWGIPIKKNLVSSQNFSHAALEFAGDLF